MPNVLESIVDNRRLRFGDNFRVQELDKTTGAVLRETDWETVADEKENEISFRFAGESSTSLLVSYTFNARNQLTLQIAKQPGVAQASALWTLQGKIFIKDVVNVEYVLLDDTGNLTNLKVEVSATLDFPNGNAQLRVSFPDKTTTTITGTKKNRSLSASAYHSGGDLARDLLAFNAVTTNTVDGDSEDIPADIKFYGRWDIHQNALVFVTKYDNTAGGTPTAYVALAGNVRGTNVGLILEQNGSAALQINGRYEWNKNTLGFDVKVGYSKAAGIEARASANAKVVGKNGTLTFQGDATLKKDKQGVALTFDLALDYTTKNGHIVFNLQSDGTGYEVQLSGDFQIQGANVKFALTVSDKNGKKVVTGSVDFGLYTANSDLKMSLQAVLGPNGLTLKADMEFRFYWGPNGPVAELK